MAVLFCGLTDEKSHKICCLAFQIYTDSMTIPMDFFLENAEENHGDFPLAHDNRMVDSNMSFQRSNMQSLIK